MFLLYYDAQNIRTEAATEAAKGFGLLRHRNAHYWGIDGCPYKDGAKAAADGLEGVVILECRAAASIAEAYKAIGVEVHRKPAPEIVEAAPAMPSGAVEELAAALADEALAAGAVDRSAPAKVEAEAKPVERETEEANPKPQRAAAKPRK